jgi:two-component system, cell cycle sensor histidine kinase and response regulator CckA
MRSIDDITAPKKARHWHSLYLALGLMLCWTFILAASARWNCNNIKNNTLALAQQDAETSLEKELLYRSWNALHGGFYAPISETAPPNPYLEIDEKNIETPSGRKLTLITPAYMTRLVHDITPETVQIVRITSLHPINPENRPDDWEEKALLEFENGAAEIHSLDDIDGAEYMRYMQPFITDNSCLKCHEQQGYKIGDIRGGIGVAIPLADYRSNCKDRCNAVLIGHSLLWLVGTLALALAMYLWKRANSVRLLEIENMRSNEKRFRLLFESSCEAAALLNEQGFIDCNHAALRMFRCFEKEQMLGKHPADFSPPTQPDGKKSRIQFTQFAAQAIKTGSLQFEWILQRLDGNCFAADIIFSSLKLDGKSCLQMVFRDISARKKAELEQKRTQEETERMNRLMTGREQRILELKQEVNLLLEELNKPARYTSVVGDDE